MQAPENTHLMRQEMIDKMSKLPHHIAVDEPIPGKGGLEDGIPGKHANTQGHHSKRNDPTYERIEHVGEE